MRPAPFPIADGLAHKEQQAHRGAEAQLTAEY
ncbi:hypothetical protein VD0002_g8646 [Verticillium dahliae]|nr:hypothetical protein VD0003_g8697 [Verticillium dahliae]PNH58883.1 hypothetical protein VD0002_g8646 [Verticillium dahliae]